MNRNSQAILASDTRPFAVDAEFVLPPVDVQEITCPAFAETTQETFPYIYAALPVIAAPDW